MSEQTLQTGCWKFLALAVVLLLYPTKGLPAEETARFTVDVKIDKASTTALEVKLQCSEGSMVSLSKEIPAGDTKSFSIPVPHDRMVTCLLGASPLPGKKFRYLGDGGSEVELLLSGCRFTSVKPGHSNFCQIEVESERTSLTVFKKWIGSGDEGPQVEVNLDCNDGVDYAPRRINTNAPDSWDLEVTESEGLQCTVSEPENEDYVGDTSDCRALVILPGAQEECTVVNTKVVKLIEVLNRYGLVIMILVFMVVGMTAAKKLIGS